MTDIEKLARALCRADGNDPDVVVTRTPPCRGNGLLAVATIVETVHVTPAWVIYAGAAELAIDWAKQGKPEGA